MTIQKASYKKGIVGGAREKRGKGLGCVASLLPGSEYLRRELIGFYV